MRQTRSWLLPGHIISINSFAAVSTLPVRWAQSYHKLRICRTIGLHLSRLKVLEILSKKLSVNFHETPVERPTA